MANEYCDWEPCHWLKKFIEAKLDEGQKAVSASIVSKSKKPKAFRVFFWYCPFCGTRLHDNKDVLGWIHQNRTRLPSAARE